jgi:hypothetical protein
MSIAIQQEAVMVMSKLFMINEETNLAMASLLFATLHYIQQVEEAALAIIDNATRRCTMGSRTGHKESSVNIAREEAGQGCQDDHDAPNHSSNTSSPLEAFISQGRNLDVSMLLMESLHKTEYNKNISFQQQE